MGTINVKSNLTGKTYPILIAGNRPTAAEDQFIQNYIAREDGVLLEAPETEEEEGSLIDIPKGIAGGFFQSLAQVPGGIASLGESVGEKLGFDVAPGESDIGRAAQDFSRGASRAIADTFDLNDSAYSKSGQAFGSLASFFIPGTAVAKGASLLGAGAKTVAGLGFGTAATQGAAVQSQDQMNRIANFLERGCIIDGSQKADAVLLSGLVGTSEAIPFAALSRSLGAGLKILKKVSKKDRDAAIKTIGGRIRRGLTAGVAEGTQELLAGIAQDLIEQGIYNPDVQVGQSAYDDAVYGGGAGAALSLILDSIRGRKLKQLDKKQQELDDDADEAARENASMAQNAKDYLKTQEDKQVKLIEGPGLGLPAPDAPIILPSGDPVTDIDNQSAVDAQENQKRKNTEDTLQAAREATTPYNPVKLESLPDDEAFKIRKQRIELKKGIPVDDPVSMQELEEVVGPEASLREKTLQKPTLNKIPPIEDNIVVEEEAELDAQETRDRIVRFQENLLKQKVINKAAAKRVYQKLFKEKMPDDVADGALAQMLGSGVLQYDGKGKYSPRSQVDINLDFIDQASALSERARQIRDAENKLRKQQEQLVNDPVNFETLNQQLDILQRRYSDVQLEAFNLENKANQAVEGQQTIQARRIAPSLAPKKVFDQAPKTKETPEYVLKQKRVLDALRAELNRIGLTDVRLEGKPLLDQVQLTEDLARGQDIGITEGIQEVSPDGKRIIALAMEIYDPNMTDAELEAKLASVMNHEVIHALKSLNVFTEQEYDILTRAAMTRKYVKRSKGKDTTRSYTYYERASHAYMRTGMPEDQIIEEAIAEMYRDYTDNKLKLGGKPKSLFDRIVAFFKSIFGSHADQGFTEADQIFENIGTTEIEKQIGRRDRKPDDPETITEPRRSRIIIDRLPDLHRGSIGPLPIAHVVKSRYLQSIGMPNTRPDRYVQVNEELARRIAKDFDEAKHDPTNPEVIQAYKAMADETFNQWLFIKDTGIQIEFIKPNQSNPYPKGSKILIIIICGFLLQTMVLAVML